MEDERKTKKQLITELNELRQSVSKIQGFEEEINQTRANQEKFTKSFLQNSIPMTITTVKGGRFVDVNNSFLRLVELKRGEVIGHTAIEKEFIVEEERSCFYKELSKNGRVENLEIEVRPKGRGVKYGLFNVVMMSFNKENYLLTTIQDITDRKLAEVALKKSEERYRSFIENANEAILVIQEGMIKLLNKRAIETFGYTEQELLSSNIFDLIHPEDLDAVMQRYLQKINGDKTPTRYTYRTIHKSGQIQWIEISSVPIDWEGKPATLNLINDITDRYLAENALRESEEKYQLLFNNSNDAIAVLGGTPPKFLLVNTAFQLLFGYTSEEILTFSANDIFLVVHPEDREMVKKNLQMRHLKEDAPDQYEFRIITKDGKIRWVEVSASLFSKGDQLFSQAIYRDITDRKKAEEVLAKSEEKYRLITENITDCIALVGEHGIIQYVTNSLEVIGYSPEEMIGVPGLSITHPDDLERIGRLYREGVEQVWREITFEMRIRSRAGHYVPMEVRARTLTDPQGQVRGGVFVARNITKNGQMNQELLSGEKSLSVPFDLTQREKEILNWIMQGKSSWDISTIINISESTVKFHINNLMKKLGAVNRTHAVAIAMREELIS